MTPICFTHTKTLFLKVNNEVHKINQWFISNKLSLNIFKKICLFFHKRSKQDDIPLLLPKLKINNYEIKRGRINYMSWCSVNKNSTCKPHMKYIENKIAKKY